MYLLEGTRTVLIKIRNNNSRSCSKNKIAIISHCEHIQERPNTQKITENNEMK